MYTDGVTEARNREKEFFEEQRLQDLLCAHEFDSAEAVVKATVSAVKQFEDGADQFDDITVLVLQFLRQPEAVEIPVLDMVLKNQLTEIDRFKESFNAFSEENDIPTPIRRELNIVFDELLNNVISYAYQDQEEHEIEVRVEATGERLVVSVSDDGIPFNPFDAEKPDTSLALEKRAIGGLGIHLVLNVMDKVAYQRRTDKNVLTMVKKLTGDK
jgi:sigma-B regulation protein RsbU (phosphoserine phosphatase)